MARSGLELQLFNTDSTGLLSSAHHNPTPSPIFQRRRSFRVIQGVISKINPEVVKSVINAANVSSATPKQDKIIFPPLPLHDPTLKLSSGGGCEGLNAEMTIFYNGTVSVFHVSPHKAQDILKLAEEGVTKSAESSDSNSYDPLNLLETLNGDLPLARRKSLQRFLAKRKERLTMVSPYDCPTNNYHSYYVPIASNPKY